MTQMVTRCPKCATAFRITSTQLESAKGAVRCGSCLHIFKAQDYLVKSAATETVNPAETAKAQQSKPEPIKTEPAKAEQLELEPIQTTETVIAEKSASAVAPTTISPAIEQPLAAVSKPATPEPETTTTAKPVIDKAKALEDEDDVLISDDMDKTNEKEGYEFDGFIDIDLHPKQTVSLFEREIRYDTPEDDDDKEDTDESWAEELLDDDEETLHQLKKAPPPLAKEPSINSDDLAQAALPEEPAEQSSGYAGPVFSLVSESTDDINEENKEEHGFSEAFLQATRAPETATNPAADPSAFAAALFDTNTFEADAEETEPEEKTSSKRPVKSPKMRAFDTSRAALLMNIMPAPVEFTAKRMRRWYQQKLWPTLSVLMAILLFFQVAYFKFDYFSRVEPTRTAYLFACPLFGCDVPPLVDIQEIETTNLIVRNHPQIAEALLVDAILINKAPFEQPFPDLILSFSKIDETPVASRRFTPKEYLGGELAGMKYIPERQPVHISLEIADPGSEAVNYTLTAH